MIGRDGRRLDAANGCDQHLAVRPIHGWKAMTILLLGGLGTGCGMSSIDPSLPVYTAEQTDSKHPGYRRTTVSTQGAVYVNDFEEAALMLDNREPTEVVGRRQFGDGKVCAIEGQSPSAYLAVDEGSEMPAYEVFRNVNQPPFAWRGAAFPKMRLAVVEGPAANKETTDAALIGDVLRTLRDGTPAIPPVVAPTMPVAGRAVRVHGVLLFSDRLPGMMFRPLYYLTESGQVYLAENAVVNYRGSEQTVQAAWISAGPLFARWVQMP